MAAAAAMASILKNLRTAAGSEDLELVFALPVGIPPSISVTRVCLLSRNRPNAYPAWSRSNKQASNWHFLKLML
jgi:hypothetical protein